MPERDAAFVAHVAEATARLVVAVEIGDRLQAIGELNRLLGMLVERKAARPQDEALRRAVTLGSP